MKHLIIGVLVLGFCHVWASDIEITQKKTKLKVSSYGIPEPVNGVAIDPKKIDLVFVPLLISDKKNYRVGYGKGFYDRFLAECRKDVKTIGLNFFKPIEKIIDLNEYDFALDAVIYADNL